MAEEQIFIPTHVTDYSGEVVGDILMDITCKALLAGQCLMTVGGYVVRGLKLACNKRAKAIRLPNGAFERVNPSSCNFILGPPQQPQPRPIMNAADDLAAAASSICLAIQENSPSPERNLNPQLEQQAAIEASDHPVQELVQLHEKKINEQFEQDTITQTLASTQAGKRPLKFFPRPGTT